MIGQPKEKCNDGKIIEATQICDGVFDCLDFEDEKNCEKCPEQVSKLSVLVTSRC